MKRSSTTCEVRVETSTKNANKSLAGPLATEYLKPPYPKPCSSYNPCGSMESCCPFPPIPRRALEGAPALKSQGVICGSTIALKPSKIQAAAAEIVPCEFPNSPAMQRKPSVTCHIIIPPPSQEHGRGRTATLDWRRLQRQQ